MPPKALPRRSASSASAGPSRLPAEAATSSAAASSSSSSEAASKRKRQLQPRTSSASVAEKLPSRDVSSAVEDAQLEIPLAEQSGNEGEEDDEESDFAGFDDEDGDGLIVPKGLDDQEESDEEEFPEIDDRSSSEGDGDADSEDGSFDSEEEDEDSEAGIPTDDTDEFDEDNEDARAEKFSSKVATQQEIDSELDAMVRRATVKPNEGDAKLNRIGLDPLSAAPLSGNRNADGSAKSHLEVSKLTGEAKRVYPTIEPDYDSDSSTEDAPNRIGNVHMEWYDELPHIGYDVDGRRVMRPAKGDELDKFLATVEDPTSWTSVEDKLLGKDVKLTDEELDIIRRLQQSEIPDSAYDPYADSVDWYTGEGKEMITPLSGRPEPKRRFVPSKWEHKKVMKIVRAIRQGRITPRAPAQTKPQIYNIWSDADAPKADHPMHLPAPKVALPTTAESYNPPAEYLFTDEEKKEWEAAETEDRKVSYLPAKHSALRLVPGYQNFVQERFERCLDLYMAPRVRRKRLEISDPDQLLPKLPSPQELKPFPTTCAVTFPHPNGTRVRCVSVDPRGAWLATGADDGRVRLWDLEIGRCAAVWDLNYGSAERDRSAVQSLAWCPNKNYSVIVAVTAGKATLIAPPQCSPGSSTAIASASFQYAIAAYQPAATAASASTAAGAPSPVSRWTRPSDAERSNGVAMHITFNGTPKQVSWHSKGDYFATVSPDGGSTSVLIHQLTRHRSQSPFRKAAKGSSVQKVAWHPTKPHFFAATQRHILLYDLSASSLLKRLQPGLKWISSLDVHPSGDDLIVGSYDKRLAWFDLDLSSKPYKTLRYHSRAIRAVAFSRQYPLFASTSDDGTIHVFHGTVYGDFERDPLIVPLKVLKGHDVVQGLGVLDAVWVPAQPWIVTAGADGTAKLWTV